MNRIVVSAVCQTGGLSAALQAIYPRAEFQPIPVLAGIPDRNAFVRLLAGADAWINCEGADTGGWGQLAASNPRLRYVNVPLIEFRAFQPDMCTAYDRRSGANCRQKYSSKIGVWAYRQGLAPAVAARFFNAGTLRRLGYLDAWDTSVAHLKARFEACGLGRHFVAFYLRVKRAGQFMHTCTHPMTAPLVALAQIAAIELGAPPDVFERSIPIPDGLDYLRWPVYPEIAAELGIASPGYAWKMQQATLQEDVYLEGVEGFLEYCYRHYRAQGFAPGDIAIREVALEAVAGAIEGSA